MLIVKDFQKLKKHGFKKSVLLVSPVYTEKDLNVWELVLNTEQNDENCISLLVNPVATECVENEMFVYAHCEDEDENGLDIVSRLDIVFEMVADGTIEYVKGDK